MLARNLRVDGKTPLYINDGDDDPQLLQDLEEQLRKSTERHSARGKQAPRRVHPVLNREAADTANTLAAEASGQQSSVPGVRLFNDSDAKQEESAEITTYGETLQIHK